jgi:protein SCO1/2
MAGLSSIGKRVLIVGGIVALGILIGWRILSAGPEGQTWSSFFGRRELRVYQPGDLHPGLVDPAVLASGGEHHISAFNLTDQRGRTITLDSLKGRVLLVDFFFTTCATICPKMSANMARVQEAYKGVPRLMLLSHSVTPEMDSVPVLAEYAERYDADPDKWLFLTGDRFQIYRLARRSYFAAVEDGDGGPDDFVHTENLVLVDTLGRLRGFYDGTKAKEVERAIEDIALLLER